MEDSVIQEEFKKVSEKFKDGNKGNVPLLNIIYNYFNGVLPTPNYISGPMSLTYQTSKEYDMNVYIFGEAHGMEKNCMELKKSNYMNVTNYLKKVFSNSDKFIDFYLEDVLFRTVKSGRREDFLTMLRDDFTDCLHPSKRTKCKFKTIRAHFVDVRQIEKKSDPYLTSPIYELIFYSLGWTDKKPTDKKISNKVALLNSYEGVAKYMLNIAINTPIIQKELDRCSLDKEKMLSIFYNILINMYPVFFDIKTLKLLSRKEISDQEKAVILTIIAGPIVDIYTIARMFKTFKKTNYFPVKPKNIIYYAGEAHSGFVRAFLNSLGFNLQFRRSPDTETYVRCLDMKGIRMDFK